MAIELNTQTTTTIKATTKSPMKWSTQPKLKAKDRMFLLEQLALLLETGIDLHTSLQTLAQQNPNARLGEILAAMAEDIAQGNPLSSAMSKHPELFSTTHISLVAASENGGYLQRILQHLLEMEKQQEALRNALTAAASYPAFLMIFSVMVVIFILTTVFPKFADLFSSIEDQLPMTTKILMAMSNSMIEYWWLMLPGAVILIVLIWSGLRSPSGRLLLDHVKMKTPGIRAIFIQLYLIQTLRVLGLSLKHGVNLLEALKITKDVVGNRYYHQFINSLIENVTEGRKLALGFQESEFIPPVVKQMMTTGEESGSLALVCGRLSEYFQNDLERRLQLATKAIEPLMLVFMGLVVGLIVSSLILPIFKLSHAVH